MMNKKPLRSDYSIHSKNKIYNDILERRKGHYIHALEVESVYCLEESISTLYSEFQEIYTLPEIISFFDSISIYCNDENNEMEVYNFNIEKFITDNLI